MARRIDFIVALRSGDDEFRKIYAVYYFNSINFFYEDDYWNWNKQLVFIYLSKLLRILQIFVECIKNYGGFWEIGLIFDKNLYDFE